MGCEHRFLKELIPSWKIEYLFVGTFNPKWTDNNSDAIYFYGRKRNNFWEILPNIFGGKSLKGCQDKAELVQYIQEKNIGVTDLITKVVNVDENNHEDRDKLTRGFSDALLNKFELEFSTNQILGLIEKNKATLKGVYFTRSSSGGISKIWKEWEKVESFCNANSITSHALITPSNYRGGAERKTKLWKEFIV